MTKEDDGGFDNRGDYFKVKSKKLREQYSLNFDIVESNEDNIFKGMTFYIDGYTSNLNVIELKNLIYKHGGKIEQYFFTAKRVTHVIAKNLAQSKVVEYQKQKRKPVKVVTPSYIQECVNQKKRLNEILFQPKELFKQSNNLLNYTTDLNSKKSDALNDISKRRQFAKTFSKLQERVITHKNKNGKEVLGMDYSKKDTGEKTFVEEYLQNSRLSLMGRIKTAMVDKYYDVLVEANEKFERKEKKWKLKDKQMHLGSISILKEDEHKSFSVASRVIVHLDMDCFFASVALTKHPELKDKPIAVSHSKGNHSDISSCNYVARKMGIKNGMYWKKARVICPELIQLPYNFEDIERVAKQVYEIIFTYTTFVQITSVDETYIDLTYHKEIFPYIKRLHHLGQEEYVPVNYEKVGKEMEDKIMAIISSIRKEIFDKTGCTASAGVSYNIMLARIATSEIKPNGQLFISPLSAQQFLFPRSIRDLPTIGYQLYRTFTDNANIQTIADLQLLEISEIEKHVPGKKKPKQLFEYAHGIDYRTLNLVPERKSIGVDINYGIRFKDESDAKVVLNNIITELTKRMSESNVIGMKMNMKVKIRVYDGEPSKYLGHGHCFERSKSKFLFEATRDAKPLYDLALELYRSFEEPHSEYRGINITMTGLQSTRKQQKDYKKRVSKNSLSHYFNKPNEGEEIMDSEISITNEDEMQESSEMFDESSNSSSTSILKRFQEAIKLPKTLSEVPQSSTKKRKIQRKRKRKQSTYLGPTITLEKKKQKSIFSYVKLPKEQQVSQKEQSDYDIRLEQQRLVEQVEAFVSIIDQQDTTHVHAFRKSVVQYHRMMDKIPPSNLKSHMELLCLECFIQYLISFVPWELDRARVHLSILYRFSPPEFYDLLATKFHELTKFKFDPIQATFIQE